MIQKGAAIGRACRGPNRLRRRGILILATVPAALAAAPSAPAATIPVNSTADVVDGAPPCTLREAIQSANADAGVGGCTAGSGTDRIELPSGTFTISIDVAEEDAAASGDLDLTEAAEIVGAGRNATIIDGNGATVGERVIDVLGGAVRLSDLEITDGMSVTGGGIRATADIELNRVDLVANLSSFLGGGVFADGVSAEIFDSSLVANRAAGTAIPAGGAIHNTGAGNLLVRDSSLIGNEAEDTDGGGNGTGGALSNFNSSTAELRDSLVAGNQTDAEGLGGGIFNTNSSTLIVRRTTVSGNSAGSGGGLASVNSAGATVVNSTFSGNDANGSGGGIQAPSTSVSVLSSTLTDNHADTDADGSGDGGGLQAGAAVDLSSSVVAGNRDIGPGTVEHECSGALGAVSYSLVGDTSCAVGTPDSNLDPATDPLLEPLGVNGGVGPTHALAEGSPLIDAGSPEPLGSADGCPPVDQRGQPRADCDIGAFEVQDEVVDGSVTARSTQRQRGRKVAVKAKVTAGEDLEAKARGKVKLKKRSYRLKRKAKAVAAGKKRTLKLKPKRKRDRRRIAKALSKGKRATAKLTVTLSDGAGNKQSERLPVKLKR